MRATFHFEEVSAPYLDTAFSVVSEGTVKIYLGNPPGVPLVQPKQTPPRSVLFVTLTLLFAVVFGVPILYFMYLYF